MTSRRLRRIAAHRARGVALTEALIVVAFFVVVFGCMSFVHRLYAEKLGASRRVRELAWTQAMAACPRGAAGAGSGVGASVDPESERLFGRVSGMDLLASPVAFSREQSGVRVTPSAGLRMAAADVRSAGAVTCNERLVDLDPHVAAEIAWRGLTRW